MGKSNNLGNSNVIYIPAKKNDGYIEVEIAIALTNFVPKFKLSRKEDMTAFWNRVTGKNYLSFSYVSGFVPISQYWLTYKGKSVPMLELLPDKPLAYDECEGRHRIVSSRGRIEYETQRSKLEREGHTFREIGPHASIMVENYKEKLFDWNAVELTVNLEPEDDRPKALSILEDENKRLHTIIEEQKKEIDCLRTILHMSGLMDRDTLSEKPIDTLLAIQWAKEAQERIEKSNAATKEMNEKLGPVFKANIEKAKD